jgi:hypothetical protein
MITGYKWTRPDGMAWYDATFGPYAVGTILTAPGATKGEPCGVGLHIGKTIEGCFQGGSFPGSLWHVESDGPMLGEDGNKIRVGSLRVLSVAEKPGWISAVETFLASIRAVPWFKPSGPPDPAWQHYAARDAAWAAARAAAGDAAGDAVWAAARAAAGDAARPAAGAAARDAAWAAAGAAARDAAWAAAGDAAWAAELQTLMAIAVDLDYPDKAKHEAHARARWDVWQRGYGCACDVDGQLFTYGAVPKQGRTI